VISARFQQTSSGNFTVRLEFTNPSQVSGGYDNYDLKLRFDPSKSTLVLPLPGQPAQQFGLSASFAGTAFVNTGQLSQGILSIGGISINPLLATNPLGSLQFTGVGSSGFSVWLDDVRIARGTTSDLYNNLNEVRFNSDGTSAEVPDGGSGSGPITSPDTTPPQVTATDPVNNGTASPTKAFINVTFDEAVVRGAGSIELRTQSGLLIEQFNVADTQRVGIAGATVSIDPTNNLQASTSYRLIISAGAFKDAAGNATASSYSFNFQTSAAGVDIIAPSLVKATPSPGAIGVATTANIVLKFSESVQIGEGEIRLLDASGSVVESFSAGSGRLSLLGDTLTIDPTNPLAVSSQYSLVFTGSVVRDLAGNAYVSSSPYQFQTARQSAASFSLAADKAQINEGGSVVFSISAPGLSQGSRLDYSISGVSAADIEGGQLTGSVTLGVSKTAQLTIRAREDGLLEGTETLTLNVEGVEAQVRILDTSAGAAVAQVIQMGSRGGTVMLSAGPDRVTGSAARDTALINGPAADYEVLIQSGKAIVSQKSSLSIDTLIGIERLQFTDQSIALNIDQAPGQLFRLYQAIFGRQPDLEGMGFWIHRMEDRGFDLVTDVYARFIDSDEFRRQYGTNPSNPEYLNKLYQNVLGRDPDVAGLTWWTNQMATNKTKSREKVLADFAEGFEFKEATAELIGQGVAFQPWLGL